MTTSRAAPFIPLVLASSFAAVLLACSKDTITAPPEKPSMAIWGGKPCGTNPNPALGGENQSGQVGQPLAKPLIVQVLDVAAGTRNGQILNFVVTSGGGTLFASVVATANPSSGPAAGCNGIGQNSWTLGPTAGPQTVAARVVDPINGATLTEATFHATATAGPAAVLKGSGGDQQTATAGTPVAIPPAVLVSDQLGNPLSGIPVTFSVKTGLGSITGPATVSTSTNGIAAVGGWTLGNTTGTNTLQAASSQFTATPVTFTAFGTTGSAAQVRVLSGNNQSQSACVGAPLPNKPTVQVLDANGNGVPTVAVTFTITGGGGSIDGVGSVTTLTSTGTASLLPGSAAVSWTLGSAPGTNTLQGTAVGLSGSPLAFNATGSGNCWTTKASMPTARENLGVAAISGILYAVGGLDNGGAPLATVEAYDPGTNKWTTKASMPTARYGLRAAAINGMLYAVGGYNNSSGYLAAVEAYDPVTDTWTTKASMTSPRVYLGIAAINGVLYAVGGYNNSSGYLATVEAYNPATNAWSTKASMSTARVGPGVTAINETLYAVGGSVSGSIPLATVEAYDPATDAWTARASMPTAREQLGVAAINRMLYAVGGLDNAHSSSQFFATVEAYDPATDAWTTKAPMPTVRGFLDAGAINGIFYAVGGQNGGAMLATVEAYQP